MCLINVDELLKKAQCTNAYFQVKSIVTGLPKIDAEPVVHGHWISRHWISKKEISELQITCNKCGYSYMEANSECEERYKYCPDCGAKMDEEVK